MKTYLISEELLNRVISTLVDYQVDSEELDNLGGIPNCWIDDLVLLKTELEELKELTEKRLTDLAKLLKNYTSLFSIQRAKLIINFILKNCLVQLFILEIKKLGQNTLQLFQQSLKT